MDYRVTAVFVEAYEYLHSATAVDVDAAIRRLLHDHQSAWARQGRVTGNGGAAWIIEVRTSASDVSIYWDYLDDQLMLLAALVNRPA
jgi:hypothetical protein